MPRARNGDVEGRWSAPAGDKVIPGCVNSAAVMTRWRSLPESDVDNRVTLVSAPADTDPDGSRQPIISRPLLPPDSFPGWSDSTSRGPFPSVCAG